MFDSDEVASVSENPGPNMTFCKGCGCYRLLFMIKPIGDNSATATVERRCVICGEVVWRG